MLPRLPASPLLAACLALLLAGAAAAQEAPKPPADATPPAESLWAKALAPVEAKIRAWDFPAAAEALKKLSFEDQALAERLATRRAEVALLAKLKAKLIAKVNAAQPRLRKSTLLIPGVNADIAKADDDGLYADRADGTEERVAWGDLTFRSVRLLIQRGASKTDPDDLLAAGVLALAYREPAAAEAYFADAKALGAAVDRHLAPLADAALAAALALAGQQRFKEAESALADLEAKYANSPWLAAHQDAIAAARARATGGGREAEAQKLYDAAARLFKDKELFECKPLVEKLKADFADTKAVRDTDRKPSVAEMAAAVAQLGKILTVRKDGKGGFKAIQEAIDAAPPRTVIVIEDGGYYGERLMIPKDKAGLTLRAKKGTWPTVGPEKGSARTFRGLLDVEAPEVAIEGILFAFPAPPKDQGATLIQVSDKVLRLRSCVLYAGGPGAACSVANHEGTTVFDHCVIAVRGYVSGLLRATDSLWLGWLDVSLSYTVTDERTVRPADEKERPPARSTLTNCVLLSLTSRDTFQIRSCTILGQVNLDGRPNFVTDSILGQLRTNLGAIEIERCGLFMGEPFVDRAKSGAACILRDPLFQDPANLDFHLRPASPCRHKAADGGDLGCRLTPGMSEMIKVALDLRRRGVTEFGPIRLAK